MPDDTILLRLTMEQVNIIAAALQNGPYKVVAPILIDLERQVRAHSEPPPEPTT